MTPSTYPDPHSHPASWCAVWSRLGGTWRIEGGAVQLLLSLDMWIGTKAAPFPRFSHPVVNKHIRLLWLAFRSAPMGTPASLRFLKALDGQILILQGSGFGANLHPEVNERAFQTRVEGGACTVIDRGGCVPSADHYKNGVGHVPRGVTTYSGITR